MENRSNGLISIAAGALIGFSGAYVVSKLVILGKSREEVERDGLETASAASRLGNAHPSMARYDCIYLDYNATTPIFPEVSSVMQPFTLLCFGNPSSSHVFSAPCKEAVKVARRHVQHLVNASSPEDILFTSCGTESDNRAIDIALHAYHVHRKNKGDPPHVVTCAIEHPAVLVYLKMLESQEKITLTTLPVDEEGSVQSAEVQSALTKNTALVTIMHSNNEVGTIQPIQAIANIIKQYNARQSTSVLFHSDAAQSLGKVTVDVEVLGVDMLTIVGHKFGAPKGIAALCVVNHDRYLRSGLEGSPLLVGGGQEFGRRGGTENVLMIAALGEAARIARVEAVATLFHLLRLKRRLVKALKRGCGALNLETDKDKAFIRFNGPERSSDDMEITSDLSLLEMILKQPSSSSSSSSKEQKGVTTEDWMKYSESCKYEDGEDEKDADLIKRPKVFSAMSGTLVEQLPNTVSVSFRNVHTQQLMPLLLSRVACSAGSACHSEAASGDILSPVLAAMRVPVEYGRGTLRLSFGRHTTEAEIDKAAAHIVESVSMLVQMQRK